MKPMRTSESDPFTDEDRARLETLVGEGRYATVNEDDAGTLARALAHINHLEKALREIAERECEDFEDWGDEGIKRCPDWCASDAEQCPSCMARDALKGEGG